MQEILNMSREVHDRSAGRGLVKEAYAGHLVAILANSPWFRSETYLRSPCTKCLTRKMRGRNFNAVHP
jgi:hypothetical protein